MVRNKEKALACLVTIFATSHAWAGLEFYDAREPEETEELVLTPSPDTVATEIVEETEPNLEAVPAVLRVEPSPTPEPTPTLAAVELDPEEREEAELRARVKARIQERENLRAVLRTEEEETHESFGD